MIGVAVELSLAIQKLQLQLTTSVDGKQSTKISTQRVRRIISRKATNCILRLYIKMNIVTLIVCASFLTSTVVCYVATCPSKNVASKTSRTRSSPLFMQLDSTIDYTAHYNLEQVLARGKSMNLRQAESEHGMPWRTSVDPKSFVDEELLYMPFWNFQMQFLEENLTDLQVVACTNGETDFSYNENTSKKARIVNLCLSSAEYRKIRLTYYDAGDNTQVFNAVFYPKSNLPILGIDLLAFNRKKYLAIVDFQPLHDDESKHDKEFSHLLQPIKESYENLSGRMSSKFYDETKFFSQQMLFSRFEDESIIQKELFPAFQQYVTTHLDLVRSVDIEETDVQNVLERQQAYDTYSAARDPATGLFTAMFGQEWAMDYVHDFLFSTSQRLELPATNADTVNRQQPAATSGNPYAKPDSTVLAKGSSSTSATQAFGLPRPQLAGVTV
jgi:15,16-dihydrobiliverdin:ferredoxin oxidoreductase